MKPTHLTHYAIRVEGCLTEKWAEWFEGLTITQENGETLLSGPVADQAALYGVLKRCAMWGWFWSPSTKSETRSKKMNSSKNAVGTLDVRIILAMLWVAGMLSSLNGDTYRLNDPAVLKASLANGGAIVVTPELLLAMGCIFAGSIFMIVLTLTLKPGVSRWANRIVGIFYALIHMVFWILTLGSLLGGRVGVYEIVWYTAQLVFSLLVVWYAWKWPQPAA